MRRLETKFLLAFVVTAVLVAGALTVWTFSETRKQYLGHLQREASLALEFDLAIRQYMGEKVRPFAQARTTSDEFVPEVMSTSFAARSIFEHVRRKFPEYLLKFSSMNPRNPLNRASPDEAEVLRYFREHPESDTWSGPVTIDGRKYVALFRARRAKAECIQCHGAPEDAPAAIVERYGPTAGFGYAVGDLMAMDTVGVPAEAIEANLTREVLGDVTIGLTGLAAVALGTIVVFRLLVGRHVSAMAAHFRCLAADDSSLSIPPVPVRGRDEVADLQNSFNALAAKIQATHQWLHQRVEERTAELKQANEQLAREVAERTRAQQASRDQVRFLETLIETIPAAVFYKDLSGRYLGCNTAFAALTSRTPQEIVGKTVYDIFPIEMAHKSALADSRLVASQKTQVYEVLVPGPDGQERHIIATKALYTDANGRPAGVVGTLLDVTDRKRHEEELRRSRAFLQTVIDAVPDALVVVDRDRRIVLANKASRQLAGGRDPVACRMPCHDVSHQCDKPCEGTDGPCPVATVFEKGTPATVTHRHTAPDGSTMFAEVTAAPIFDDSGNVVQAIEICRDVTARKRAEEALQQSEERLRNHIENLPIGVFRTTPGPEGRFLMANPAILRMHHVDNFEALARIAVAEIYADPAARKKFSDKLCTQGSVTREEVHLRRLDGTEFWGAITARAVRDQAGRVIYFDGTMEDITDLKLAREALQEANRQLEQLARTDVLTGLLNRRRFLEMLQHEFQRVRRSGGPLALLMLDVDHFKAINDTYGHAFGDMVLVEVARLLKAEARASDVVARYGGEEFLVLMPDTTLLDAAAAAERLRMRMAEKVIEDSDHAIRVTISVGVSAIEADGATSPDGLIRLADEAMYAAKQAGRNKVCTWKDLPHAAAGAAVTHGRPEGE